MAESKHFFVKPEYPSFAYRRNIISSPTHTTVPLDEQRYISSRRCFSSSSDILQNQFSTLLNTAAENKRFSTSTSSSEVSPKFDNSKNLNKQVNQIVLYIHLPKR